MTEAPSYRWVVLTVGVGVQAAGGAFVQGLPAVAPALRAGYGLDLAEVGVALGGVLGGMTLALLAWGMLADRIGERRVTVIGALGSGAALAAASATSSLAGLTACLALAGLMVASVNVASGRSLVGWFGPGERGTVLGVRQASLPVGGAVAAALLPLIALPNRPDRALLALAAAMGVGACVAGMWMREPPRPPPARATGDSPLRDRRLWVLAAASAMLSSVQFAFLGFLVLFLHEQRGVGVRLAALSLVVLQLGGAAARVLIGLWSDRRRVRLALLRRLGAAVTVALGGTAALVAGGAASWLVVTTMMATGVLVMCWNGVAFVAAAEIASPSRTGTALGMQTTALALGGAIALPVFGVVVATAGWAAAITLLATVALVAWSMLRALHLGELRAPAVAGPAQSSP